MQNGISKIVKSWIFNQFLLKSKRLQPHYIDAGDIIQPDTERSIHQSSDLVGVQNFSMTPPPPPPHHHHHLLVFMVSRVTGHPVVPSRMIYNNIISKKHSHYPQLLGTSYKVSEIISLKKFAIFMRKGK